MKGLSAAEMIGTWERGLAQSAGERAATILAVAWPSVAAHEVLALTIGQRDTALFDLRLASFGAAFEGYAECPQCGEPLEFELDLRDLRLDRPAIDQPSYHLDIAPYVIVFRLPTVGDLRAITALSDPAHAQELLLERCVIQARCADQLCAVDELPASIIEAIAQNMAAHDPQAETTLQLDCPACSHAWAAVFEISQVLWSDIARAAKRLLREVHLLAQAYGWHEAEILALSAQRRQHYLEMVGT